MRFLIVVVVVFAAVVAASKLLEPGKTIVAGEISQTTYDELWDEAPPTGPTGSYMTGSSIDSHTHTHLPPFGTVVPGCMSTSGRGAIRNSARAARSLLV